MKKKILIVSLFISTLLLTGCVNNSGEALNKEKVLECKKTTKESINFDSIMNYHYVDGLIKKVIITYDYDLSNFSEEQKNSFIKSNFCKNESFINILGLKDCKEELKDTRYIVSGNATKIVSQVKETIIEAKTSQEKDGWTCIIK